MNVIDKKRMLEGLLYNVHFECHDVTAREMDSFIQAKKTLRDAGLLITADEYGRLSIKRISQDFKQIAITLTL